MYHKQLLGLEASCRSVSQGRAERTARGHGGTFLRAKQCNHQSHRFSDWKEAGTRLRSFRHNVVHSHVFLCSFSWVQGILSSVLGGPGAAPSGSQLNGPVVRCKDPEMWWCTGLWACAGSTAPGQESGAPVWILAGLQAPCMGSERVRPSEQSTLTPAPLPLMVLVGTLQEHRPGGHPLLACPCSRLSTHSHGEE